MLANDRQEKILEIIERKGSIKTSQLVEVFDVSLETIRRDFEVLEKQGILEKVYGGAILKNRENKTLTYSLREQNNVEEKKEVAKIALKLIKEGDTIALNASTTNLEIAKLIKENFIKLTVITNSLMIANEIANIQGINLILAGGIYNKSEFAFLGEMTAKAFCNFSVDKVFICVGGVSLKRGLTDNLMDEILVERKMIEIAEKVYILADSSKIETNSLLKLSDLKENMAVVTDSNLSTEIIEEYRNNNIKLIVGKL